MPVDTQQNHCGGEEGIMLKRGYSLKYRRIYKIWQGEIKYWGVSA